MESAHLLVFVSLLIYALAVPDFCATNGDSFTPIGDGFYLPDRDMYGHLSHGVSIFANLPDNCAHVVPEPQNNQKSTFYDHSKSFYQHVSSATGLSVNLQGAFTMGTTLTAASDSIASLKSNVSGLSLDVYATKEYVVLDQDCVNTLKLSPELLLDFKNLPLKINAPEQKSSWREYDTFLYKYGSHIVSEVHRGSRLLHWTFSQTSNAYSKKNFTTRACIDTANIPTEAGLLGITACANYSNDEIKTAMSMTVSNTLILKGGKSDTRSRLHGERTPKLIQQFLREAMTDPGDIKYRFLPVWQILEVHFIGTDQANFQRSLLLEQYYRGFLDFGCELQQAHGLVLRKFQYKSTPQQPEFTCTLEHIGCHEDDDCNLRYNTGPTYCYGRTCVQAKEVKDAGSKQKETLSILEDHREGHHDEPPNTSCYYALGPRAVCHYTDDWKPQRHQIWPLHDEEVNYSLFMSLHRKFKSLKMSVPRQEL